MIVTRFAPSPTGHLHLGHAYSSIFAFKQATQSNGRFLLRIEDIDPIRCKAEFTNDLMEDLLWLGLTWQEPVRRQSEHFADYATALSKLRDLGLIYPCFCSRREVAAEAAVSVYAPHQIEQGSSEIVYAGTCRHLSTEEQQRRLKEQGAANWRLDVSKARLLTGDLFWRDQELGMIKASPQNFGDVVLARKDVQTSYHLSVTVDDNLQGVNLVTRGNDLFQATHIHRLLQELLGYSVPEYHHHPLLCDSAGKRYAKRDKSVTLRSLRREGRTVADIYNTVGLSI